jgi:hypothetical protein
VFYHGPFVACHIQAGMASGRYLWLLYRFGRQPEYAIILKQQRRGLGPMFPKYCISSQKSQNIEDLITLFQVSKGFQSKEEAGGWIQF